MPTNNTRPSTMDGEDGWNSPPRGLGAGVWSISNYSDVCRVFQDRRFGSALFFAPAEIPTETRCPWMKMLRTLQRTLDIPTPGSVRDLMKNAISFTNPPTHARLLSPIKKSFLSVLPKQKSGLYESAQALMTRASSLGTTDWMEQVARPYARQAMLAMSGLPENISADLFNGLTHLSQLFSLNPSPSAQHTAAFLKTVRLIDKSLSSPACLKPGFVTALLENTSRESGLRHEEIHSNIVLLFMAGVHSVPRLLSGGMLLLLQNKGLLEELEQHTDRMPGAIQEILRLISPQNFIQRKMLHDISIQGVRLAKDDIVILDLFAANHDPKVFPHPEEAIFTRSHNPHVAFGQDIHVCIGSPLARMEAEIFYTVFMEKNRMVPMTLRKAVVENPQQPYSVNELWIQA